MRPVVGENAKNGSQRTPTFKVKFGLRRIVSCTNPAQDVPLTSLNSPAPCSNSLALPSKKSAKSTPVNWPLNEISEIGRHTSELQSRLHLVCRLLLEKKKKKHIEINRRQKHRNARIEL